MKTPKCKDCQNEECRTACDCDTCMEADAACHGDCDANDPNECQGCVLTRLANEEREFDEDMVRGRR